MCLEFFEEEEEEKKKKKIQKHTNRKSLSSFFSFSPLFASKKHTSRETHTRRTERQNSSLRNKINTHAQTHTHTHREKAGNNCALSFSRSFFFSRFQRESFIHTFSALKKKREIALKIHLKSEREFEILNIRFCARERTLRASSP